MTTFNFGHNEDGQQSLFNDLVAQKPRCNIDKEMLETLLDHYKRNGFPYLSLHDYEKVKEYDDLRKLPRSNIEDKTFFSDSTGVALANSYHPHRYEIPCGGHRTAMYVFQRAHLLRKAIQKCIALSGSVDDAKLRSMLSIFEGTQVASNFPPGTAKQIYSHFLPDGGIVWDMSMGFGGRLLAALSTENIVYYGTDPSTKTFAGLNRMVEDLTNLGRPPIKTPTLINYGSETFATFEKLAPVDFCFTSPPYFNTEKYAYEETQSYMAYPYRSVWIKKFIGGTANNCNILLSPGNFAAINIANVKSFPNIEQETVKEFCRHGFKLDDVYYLAYNMMPGKGSKNKQYESGKRHRKEPIFIFKKL